MREHFEMVFGREKSRRLATYRFFANGGLQNKLSLELGDKLALVVSPRRPRQTDYRRLFETVCQNLSLNRTGNSRSYRDRMAYAVESTARRLDQSMSPVPF